MPVYPASGYDFEATPDGQNYTLDIKSRYIEKFAGPYVNLYAAGLWGTYNRGIVSDGWIINNANLVKQKGGLGVLTINWESIVDVPPDEWSVEPMDLQPRIERHPAFAALLTSDFALVQQAMLASSTDGLTTAYNQFDGASDPDLVTILYDLMRNGCETYYLSAQRYTWTTYYQPGESLTLSNGGYTETPGGPGAYLLPSGFGWLRESDNYGMALYSPAGGILKVTRHWIGAPSGYWDNIIYPSM